jgi:hypothetical protein
MYNVVAQCLEWAPRNSSPPSFHEQATSLGRATVKYSAGAPSAMASTLSSTNRGRLERALRAYDVKWDEPIEKIHPHLQRDRCVSARADWIGTKENKGIVRWKAARALKRARWSWKVPDSTREAFALASSGSKRGLVAAVKLLDELPGVGVRMATAILMFYDPGKFSVMDVNAWRSLVHLGFADAFDFWYEDAADYPAYNEACLVLSQEFHHTLRDADRALWTLGDAEGDLEAYEAG